MIIRTIYQGNKKKCSPFYSYPAFVKSSLFTGSINSLTGLLMPEEETVAQTYHAKISERLKGNQQELWRSNCTCVNLVKMNTEPAGAWSKNLKIWNGMWEMLDVGHLILFYLFFFPYGRQKRNISRNSSFQILFSFLFHVVLTFIVFLYPHLGKIVTFAMNSTEFNGCQITEIQSSMWRN